MMLHWRTSDPAATTRRLADLGFETDRLEFDGGSLLIVRGEAGDRLEVVDDRPPTSHAVPEPHPNGLSRLVGIAWATVDLDRAAASSGAAVRALASDRLLGARAALLGDGPIVLLEPETEGRLAATLARRGEGPAGLYLAAADGLVPGATNRPAGDGPFGRSVLLEPAAIRGPHLLACEGRLVAAAGPPTSDTIGR